MTKKEKIQELLTRGVAEVIDKEHLLKRLQGGRKLRVKLGFDPTSPYLHLGRAVQLLKLRDFQELGHQIVFVIGDFTGVIGDTSDKSAERPMLNASVVRKNMKTYEQQVGKILDLNRVEIRYNSQWLGKLGYGEISRQANLFSLAEFMARKNIHDRYERGSRISLRELLYPLMQGYDSVAIKADVEIGGTDQRFNLLAGRPLQEFYKQPPQDILTSNLLEGLDGRKMSSSWGNTIHLLDKPTDMFGKLMSMKDALMVTYFIHCTRVPFERIQTYEKDLRADRVHPRDVKLDLAFEITRMYWGEKEALSARAGFLQVFQKKNVPEDISEKKVRSSGIVDVLVETRLVASRSEARRVILQKGLKKNGRVVADSHETVKRGDILQKGKRHFVKIV